MMVDLLLKLAISQCPVQTHLLCPDFVRQRHQNYLESNAESFTNWSKKGKGHALGNSKSISPGEHVTSYSGEPFIVNHSKKRFCSAFRVLELFITINMVHSWWTSVE